jgi:hypothetical protein
MDIMRERKNPNWAYADDKASLNIIRKEKIES